MEDLEQKVAVLEKRVAVLDREAQEQPDKITKEINEYLSNYFEKLREHRPILS